jgi:hypothetical protein
MKRILYAFGIVALVAAVIAIGYFFRYRAETTIPGNDSNSTGAGGLPNRAPQSSGGGLLGGATGGQTNGATGGTLLNGLTLGLVSNREVQSFAVAEGGGVSLMEPDGKIVRVVSGKEEVISATPISSLITSAFSADGKKVFATFLAGDMKQSNVFDLDTTSWSSLPEDARDLFWSSVGATLGFTRPTSNGTEILSRDMRVAKSSPQTLASLSVEDVTLSWPSPNTIIITPKSSARITASILSLNTKNKTFGFVTEDERGLMSIWNASSSRGLVFVAGRRGGDLSVRTADGTVLNRFSLLTLPSKCVFGTEERLPGVSASSTAQTTSSTTTTTKKTRVEVLYCGIPRNTDILASAELPDSYLKHAIYAEDNIYKIDLSDGFVETLWSDESVAIDMDALKIAGDKLYFINRYDKKLYVLTLAISQ